MVVLVLASHTPMLFKFPIKRMILLDRTFAVKLVINGRFWEFLYLDAMFISAFFAQGQLITSSISLTIYNTAQQHNLSIFRISNIASHQRHDHLWLMMPIVP